MRTAPYFAAIGFLVLVHAARVIKLRIKHKVLFGDSGISELHLATRIFGNNAEYAPLGLVLLLALEYISAPVWYLHLVGATLVLGRLSHASGLSRSDLRFRVGGMVLTMVSIALASIGVFLFSII